MKKIILPAMLLFLQCLLVLPIFASAAENSISLSYQLIDSEIIPGGETTMIMTMSNPSSSLPISNIRLYLAEGKYVSASPAYIEAGGLAPSTNQQTSFALKADASAVSGTDYIKARAAYTADTTIKETSINIPIKIARDPILQISKSSYSTTPSPGNETRLTLYITNYGNGDAKDIVLSLNKTDLFIADAYEAFAKEIKAGSAAAVPFALTISPSADMGAHSINVLFKYRSENRGKNFTETKTVPLRIEGGFGFIVGAEDYSLAEGLDGEVTVRISNAGTSEAQFLTLKAEGQTVYLGTLKSDDYESETIKIKPASAGKYPLAVEISYKDMFGKNYAEKFVLELDVMTMEEYESSKALSSSILAFVFIAFILGAACFFYMRRKRR